MSSLLSLAVLPHLSFGSCSFSFPGNESFRVFPWRRPLPSDLCPSSRSPLPLVRLDQLTLPAPSSSLDSSCVASIRALSDNRALHLALNILCLLSSPPPPHPPSYWQTPEHCSVFLVTSAGGGPGPPGDGLMLRVSVSLLRCLWILWGHSRYYQILEGKGIWAYWQEDSHRSSLFHSR